MKQKTYTIHGRDYLVNFDWQGKIMSVRNRFRKDGKSYLRYLKDHGRIWRKIEKTINE